MVIRDIVADDATAMGRVIVTATKTAFTGFAPDACLSWLTADERIACRRQALAAGNDIEEAQTAADIARSAENWRRSLAHGPEPGEIQLVAEEDGVVVGYAIAETSADDSIYRAELTGLYILPFSQRRGVGRALIREIAHRLTSQGIHSLRVGVLRINPNRPFYERLGGQYLYDRDFNWDGVIFPECVYGWKDTRELLS